MRKLYQTNQFKRDVKRVQKSGACTLEELQRAVDMLRGDSPLPPHMKDHPLKGDWKPSRDCHIKPDIVLVYTKIPGQLHLRRLGSHSELFR